MIYILSTLALALAPAIYLAIIIYGHDKYDREPKRILLVAFLLGVLSTIPAVILEGTWDAMGYDVTDNFIETAIYVFFGIGLTEEFCKFLMVRYHAFPKKEFNEPFDGIVYSAFVALGFAAFENIFYVFDYGWGTGIMRMFTAVPAHYSFGVIMGYYIGKAKFDPENRLRFLIQGLLYASILHAAYDFFLMQQNYVILVPLGFIVLIVSWKLSKRAIKEMKTDSMFRFKSTK